VDTVFTVFTDANDGPARPVAIVRGNTRKANFRFAVHLLREQAEGISRVLV